MNVFVDFRLLVFISLMTKIGHISIGLLAPLAFAFEWMQMILSIELFLFEMLEITDAYCNHL